LGREKLDKGGLSGKGEEAQRLFIDSTFPLTQQDRRTLIQAAQENLLERGEAYKGKEAKMGPPAGNAVQRRPGGGSQGGESRRGKKGRPFVLLEGRGFSGSSKLVEKAREKERGYGEEQRYRRGNGKRRRGGCPTQGENSDTGGVVSGGREGLPVKGAHSLREVPPRGPLRRKVK